MGRDVVHDSDTSTVLNFNPPSPYGEGRFLLRRNLHSLQFQSTLPVWGGTDAVNHSLPSRRHFNPPSPYGEGPRKPSLVFRRIRFQSTLPVWGGTAKTLSSSTTSSNFNPPSPYGEGHEADMMETLNVSNFNPPSPYGEGPPFGALLTGSRKFQSTLPVWGGTFTTLLHIPPE